VGFHDASLKIWGVLDGEPARAAAFPVNVPHQAKAHGISL
jgi:hypothetical protein